MKTIEDRNKISKIKMFKRWKKETLNKIIRLERQLEKEKEYVLNIDKFIKDLSDGDKEKWY